MPMFSFEFQGAWFGFVVAKTTIWKGIQQTGAYLARKYEMPPAGKKTIGRPMMRALKPPSFNWLMFSVGYLQSVCSH